MQRRIDVNIRQDQYEALKSLNGQISDHIRNAIDDYIEKKTAKPTQSPSEKGVVNA